MNNEYMTDDQNPELVLMKLKDRAFAALADMEAAKRKFQQSLSEIDRHLEVADTGVYRIRPGMEISCQLEAGGEILTDTVRDVSFKGQTVVTDSGVWVGFSQIRRVRPSHIRLVEGGGCL